MTSQHVMTRLRCHNSVVGATKQSESTKGHEVQLMFLLGRICPI